MLRREQFQEVASQILGTVSAKTFRNKICLEAGACNDIISTDNDAINAVFRTALSVDRMDFASY